MNERNNNLKQLFISQSFKTCSNFHRNQKLRNFTNTNKNRYIQSKRNKKNQILNIFNVKKSAFNSFHKMLMHRKFVSKSNCKTERKKEKESGMKDGLEDYKTISRNHYETIFLTNENEFGNI